MVSASDLNKRITIQKFNHIQQNENGFDEEFWDDYKTVWASMNNLWGKVFYAAKAVNEENTVEFVVRYGKYIDTLDNKKYRIKTKNRSKDEYKYYKIVFIDNIKYKNQFVNIKAQEIISAYPLEKVE